MVLPYRRNLVLGRLNFAIVKGKLNEKLGVRLLVIDPVKVNHIPLQKLGTFLRGKVLKKNY